MKDIQIFNYNNNEIRVVKKDGEAWFMAKDVCNVLGLKNSRKAVSELYDNEKDVTKSYTLGGNQEMTIINEPGLYKLIFKSRKPEAKKFQDWVFYKVLPDIRKHGIYMSDKAQEILKTDPEAFDKLLGKYVAERDRARELEKKLDAERSFSVLGHVVLSLPESITVKDAADFLAQHGIEIGQNRLFKRLREANLLCRRKGRQWNKPTKKALDQGLLNLQIENGFTPITMVTPKGLKVFSNEFVSETYPLLVLLDNSTTDGTEE